jgi:phosphatidylserine/phosphatidylglycerophosphate/cardiolipin synthase-like enzyme
MANPPHAVSNERIPEHAERLLAGPVALGDLALAFSESTASSAEVLVEGDSFYPRMLEDIASASSSVHINQFGFRPGIVGDAFAEALIGKAAEGVPVRLVVDRRGSDPERGAQALYDRFLTGGIEVCVVRAMQARAPAGPLGRAGVVRLNLAQLGHVDHRKVTVIDGRIGWVGGAGIEDHFQDGRFHDLFVRVAGPVVAQRSWSSSPASAGSEARYRLSSSMRSFRRSGTARTRLPRSSCTTRPAGTARSPTRSSAFSTVRTRRSTSSTRTSRIGG